MNSQTPLLQVTDLAIELLPAEERPQPQSLLREVSFEIRRGEILALVGESGSGKSLTSLAIMRLLPDVLNICAGRVELDGRNLFALSEQEMNSVRGRRIAMIFQEPQSSLNPVQTVEQQIGEVLALHQNIRGQALTEKVVALLEEVGIPEARQRLSWYPHQLSGGQKQRVMIAIALACEPQLLIADEPTTALDVTIQQQILQLLDSLRRQRDLGILLITHDMGVVNAMADRVAVMRHGDILEQAEVQSFFRQPVHEYSRMLIHSLPDRRHFLPASQQPPLLEVDNIQVWFAQRKGILQRIAGYTRAVNGISFTIRRGETLALVGESGCGKTTAGRALLNMEPLAGGQIRFAGERIDTLSQKAFKPLRKRIQVIFQDPFSSMNPRMSVREILAEGMVALKVANDPQELEQRMLALLEKVGLEAAHLDRFPHEFSGGQRQRLAIARAVAVEPELIICDEPTSALDVSIRSQVLGLLRNLQQEMGLSYLFITHDLSIIPHIAHRVAVMKDGILLEQGDTQQVLTAPQHAYTRSLLASVPEPIATV